MEHLAVSHTQSTIIKKRKNKNLKNLYLGLLFTSPVLLGYSIFVLVPLLITIILSFTDFSIGAVHTKFVGLHNFIDMFNGRDNFFYPAIKATAYYVSFSVPLSIIVSFLIAVLLNQKIKFRGFFRAIFYLPVVIPLASSSMIWLWMLQPDFGVVNYLLGLIGISPSSWLASPTTVVPTLILFSLWLCGSSIVIFLAGLQSIPSHLYEALEVDGGNNWHRLVYITIPMSSPIIFFNTVIGFINAIQTFVQPAIMTSGGAGSAGSSYGGPGSSSLFYVLYMFQNAFKFQKMGAASASVLVLLAVTLFFTAVFFKLSGSFVHQEGGGNNK
ncbi:carbohydrate ABC transporter permease [Paenibacillus sp. Soil787]|uniref:carbohydrate ABC transporter permease n=1 Tax=Paenibacillus sp. Soil787 TaxID=1736411 RepID=UPI0007C7D4E6|nr:sugar ABC transporter permease [Paenibacillus sp. Soil787]